MGGERGFSRGPSSCGKNVAASETPTRSKTEVPYMRVYVYSGKKEFGDSRINHKYSVRAAGWIRCASSPNLARATWRPMREKEAKKNNEYVKAKYRGRKKEGK